MKDQNSKNAVDLHVHTIYSDGMLSPSEIVEKAIERGLEAIAITDHDCVDGVKPTEMAAAKKDLEIVPGVELSCAKGDSEIHLLGYFIDCGNEALLTQLRKMQKNRVERIKKMILLLEKNGISISLEKVFKDVIKGTVGRLYLARVMVEENKVRDIKEAFDKYLADGKCCCVRHEKLSYETAIDLIRNAGGVPVLAHPGTMGRDEDIPSYIAAGLRGLEVIHTKHHMAASNKYIELAKKHDLLITGGSDCHGMGKRGILMGKVSVGYEVVTALIEESKKIRSLRH